MKLTWYGLSCFYLEGEQTTVLMDPFDDSCGYKVPYVNANIWTSSHDHYDHNNKAAVINKSVIDGFDGLIINDVRIVTIHTYHDKVKGKEWGENLITIIEMEGMTIAHLGDLGHELNKEQLEQLGLIDILLIPTGGFFTINEAEAASVAKAVNARLTIPMHYYTNHLKGFNLGQGLDIFLQELGYPYKYKPDNSLMANINSLPDHEVIVLQLA